LAGEEVIALSDFILTVLEMTGAKLLADFIGKAIKKLLRNWR